jgi:hypothetical protein
VIRIGTLKLETAVPDDLHRRLLASMGCSVAEIAALLEQSVHRGHSRGRPGPAAGRVLPKVELARLIASAGVDVVRRRVAKLYAEILNPKKEPSVANEEPEPVEAEAEAEAPPEVDVRGQIAVPLDGSDYVLRPSEEAIATIERTLGCSLNVLVEKATYSAADAR